MELYRTRHAGSVADSGALTITSNHRLDRCVMKIDVNLANASICVAIVLFSGIVLNSSLFSTLVSGRTSHADTAAFVVLVGPATPKSNRTRGLEVALHSLYHNYQVLHKPRPVILFYGNDIPPEQYAPEVIRGIMPAGMADLVEVIVLANFTALPDNMYTVTLHDILARDKYPGYQNMCRWNLFGMLQHSRIRDLQYYVRFDTDSRFKRPIEHDVFDAMAERGLHYGYTEMSSETPQVARGMWDFAADYVNTHFGDMETARAARNEFFGNLTVGLASKERFQMVKNEFEIVHVPRFRQPDIVQFAATVDATHKIYESRWGDSPLRWLECLLFLEVEEEIARFDVHYAQDKGNVWKPPMEWGIGAGYKKGAA